MGRSTLTGQALAVTNAGAQARITPKGGEFKLSIESTAKVRVTMLTDGPF